mmetsp:Transcript_73520/g.198841  ORF Transcript_73520/g.198841 Transcript_73520/m.198841 type:complete len:246 (-) Transcript_73520:994-1731(-)
MRLGTAEGLLLPRGCRCGPCRERLPSLQRGRHSDGRDRRASEVLLRNAPIAVVVQYLEKPVPGLASAAAAVLPAGTLLAGLARAAVVQALLAQARRRRRGRPGAGPVGGALRGQRRHRPRPRLLAAAPLRGACQPLPAEAAEQHAREDDDERRADAQPRPGQLAWLQGGRGGRGGAAGRNRAHVQGLARPRGSVPEKDHRALRGGRQRRPGRRRCQRGGQSGDGAGLAVRGEPSSQARDEAGHAH